MIDNAAPFVDYHKSNKDQEQRPMTEEKREQHLERLRANSRRYYERHKEELSARRKTARAAKLAGMSEEEREALKARNREYQKAYRKAHPEKVAVWTARTWLRKLERCGEEKQNNV